MNPEPERLFRAPFVRLLSAQVLAAFCVCAFYLLPKFLSADLHATAWEIGLLSAAYGIAGALAVPILAAASDRFSARALVLVAFAVLAASAVGFVWVDRVGPLALALRTAQGIAWAVMFTSGMVLTIRLAPPSRLAQAIGYYGVANLSMNAIAPATAEMIAEKAGWTPIFVLASIVGWLAFALGFRLPDDRPVSTHTIRTWDLLLQPGSLAMVVIFTIWGVAFGAMFTFHQPFALMLGIRNLRGFFIAYTATAVLARVGMGDIIDRVGRHRMSVASLTLYALVVLSMQGLRPGWLEPIGAAFGLAHGLFFPTYSALTVERARPEERGKIVALSNAAFSAGFGGGGPLLGSIAEHRGYPRLYLVAGLMTFGAVGLLLTTAPTKRVARADGPGS